MGQLILMGLLCGLLAACAGPAAGPMLPAAAQRVGLAIYMVGSDLEDDIAPRNDVADEAETGKQSKLGAGSSDLREMVLALTELPAEARQGLDLLVAFGGARKQGWQGIKYADADCLIHDAEDGYFGNDRCYGASDPEADMGDGATLQAFLEKSRQLAPDGRRMLILWDHGMGYLGIGADGNHAGDALELGEIGQAFAASRAHFDLIGFDACLMATLEVAHQLVPYGKYLVASQATEPGHGWNYQDVLKRLALVQDQDPLALGRFLVDSYQETEAHRKQVNKTLALLDLAKVPAVIAALDRLTDQLDLAQFETLLQSLRHSQGFGQSPADDSELSVDLADWLQKLAQALPETQGPVREALTAVQQLVLYQRQDGSNPQANGIGIFAFSRSLNQFYTSAQAFSPAWFGFTQAFHLRGSSDSQRPSLVDLDARRGCPGSSQDGKAAGHCFEIRDDVGLADVSQVFAVNRLDGSLQLIGRDRLDPELEQPHRFFMPAWSGRWFLLCDGNCLEGQAVFPPLDFESYNSERHTSVYAADAVLNDQKIQFFLEVDEQGEVVNQWALPYQLVKGRLLISRLSLPLRQGDRLRFVYRILAPDHQTQRQESGPEIRFAHQPVWQYSTVADSLTYYLEATDYQGNRRLSDVLELAAFQGGQE